MPTVVSLGMIVPLGITNTPSHTQYLSKVLSGKPSVEIVTLSPILITDISYDNRIGE